MAATKHLVISGRVQGVGYRDWMIREAGQAGLHGWVRNRRDGTVEAVLHGSEKVIEQLIERAYNGPLAARVTGITVADGVYDGPPSFEARPTV